MYISLYFGSSPQFWGSLYDFAVSKFSFYVTENGYINWEIVSAPTVNKNGTSKGSYNMEQYSKEEVLKDFINSEPFKNLVKSCFYEFYKVEQII